MREPSPPERHLDVSISEPKAIETSDGSSAIDDVIDGQILSIETLKRSYPDTSELFENELDRPAKVRKVDKNGPHGASQERGNSPAQDSDQEDNDSGHRDLPTWKPDLTAIGPIAITSAWTHLYPPISPFFSPVGNASERATVLEGWVYGHQHNKLQIDALAPTEIWIRIIRQCDNMTVWMLRNTCRVMMTLCEASVPSLRGRRGRARPNLCIERGDDPWRGLEKHRDEMKAQLNRQQFCQPCQENRIEWPDEVFYDMYPEVVMERTDMGHSGSVPICEHISITAEMLEGWWEAMPASPRRIICRHETHDKYCDLDGRPSITIREHSDVVGDDDETIADVQWEAAIVSLPCDENGTPVKRLSYTSLRDLIWAEASKADNGLPRLLCPHLSWKDHSLLRPFDSTVCACLDTDNISMCEAQERHDAAYCVFHRKDRKCCLCNMSKCDKAGIFIPEGEVGGQNVVHGASCTDCSTWYGWTRRFNSKTNRWKLWLKMKCRIDDDDATSKSWLHRIDPETIGENFARHESLKHHSWCDDGNCATSYRYRRNARLLLIEGKEPWK